jgi:hypothetical protein
MYAWKCINNFQLVDNGDLTTLYVNVFGKVKEQGTVLAKICRYHKLNKIYIGQKPRICPVQWYMIHLCTSKIAN